ncbi:peptidoglycan/LPS O-acetylase OafA/YrhL [Sediminihabitans luteus]|uniref:Peptidoglycan/LPS O-acetylase OafA/YrhL n=1 Tax=Sediminihabitans luteus TaxID=1138585 RepID=A0A2M9CDX5_9CELL|nr:acyltransferase [Sediminihabitans luteus]PJJ70134.1 peptidoglycan/LPS O-acetylase OafA/YrhL [Sediminihabitans luteus]GIJ00565.1 hypothetical protein Slu03_29420 [Sediminihabitans luteus]
MTTLRAEPEPTHPGTTPADDLPTADPAADALPTTDLPTTDHRATDQRAEHASPPPASAVPTGPAGRLRALDGLRFAAAAAVVAYHFTGNPSTAWGTPGDQVFPTLNEVTRYGYLGVEVFFVVSGFVITMSALGRDVPDFVASRVSRLFPAYWAAVVLTAVLQAFWHGGRTPSASDTLLNLTMVQRAFGAQDVQGAFWTLWAELRFYLLVALLVAWGLTRGRLVAFAVLWPLTGQLAETAGADLLAQVLVAPYAPYFALGIALHLLQREQSARRGGLTVAWLLVALELSLCLRHAVHAAQGRPVSPAVVAAVVLVGAALVWACTSGPLRDLRWRWLTAAGALTYPLYLVHTQLGFAVIDLLHARVPAWLVVVTAVAASLAVAHVLHRVVERPLAAPLRRAVSRGLRLGWDGAGTARTGSADRPST